MLQSTTGDAINGTVGIERRTREEHSFPAYGSIINNNISHGRVNQGQSTIAYNVQKMKQ